MAYDEAMQAIADYVCDAPITSDEAYQTARLCLLDSLGCALLALNYPACTKLLGPVITGTTVPEGCRVPGTEYVLDPIQGAFNIGTLVRWLDFNDTWLAAEWGHPSDNLGGILAVCDYLSRHRHTISCEEMLTAMIKAHEIQGVLALKNSFNRVGLDHVILVRVATAAVTARLLGGSKEQVLSAISNAWIDGGALRCYRHYPNTGSRKSWAAGDASSRGVMHAFMALKGEMGYPAALSVPNWGFYDVLFGGKAFEFARPLGSYVMENVLFKIRFPAEFHAQTAVECAVILHPLLIDRLEEIENIAVTTHESAIRIIDKKGPLKNPADRDHCLQYMIAVALLFGDLTADHYEEVVAQDPRIDRLRCLMTVTEHLRYSEEYLHPDKRSIANAIQVNFKNGDMIQEEVEYPLGHRLRRDEGIPLIYEKFENNAKTRFSSEKVDQILNLFKDHHQLLSLPVHKLCNKLCGVR